jgi:phenylalanyl-tRNA synthetase alpha chain
MDEQFISALVERANSAIAQAESLDGLEALRLAYLGKKGELSAALQNLGKLPADERKNVGARLNLARNSVSDALDLRKEFLEKQALDLRLKQEQVDVTLPIRPQMRGSLHPVMRVIDQITDYFSAQNFVISDGPEVEDDFHNFTALNIPPHHPARAMQDTFYMNSMDGAGVPYLLRTHTSSVQIRAMLAGKPPFRIIAPGRVYRSDYDMTHTPMFHQIEGIVIERGINMGHLKGCLQEFLRDFFALPDVPIRFRPSFFPFTEPSAEVDIGCIKGNGTLAIGGDVNSCDWLEVLGSGMVNAEVLRHVGLDPNEWQGFAFGLGVERLTMLKYGIADLRQCFEGDVRWLSHYGREE